ncbi:acyl-CoA dehydratase activase [Caminicella sporogenes]|uniref:acyl-CoA dehydratase activase n=1 Tax=Caminicella sporogenes TaxID=166485 RepID=UPI00253F7111|nr:acyl-CoA dehydratase activase [Caminicella sporogenes]WIF94221.1 acyl-CoA dehydratase activase [Caminicella sporogenes]
MTFLGIDLGSRAVKIILLDSSGKVIKEKILGTMTFYRDYTNYIGGKIHVDFEKLGLDREKIDIVSTGYGRNNLKIYNATVINEIKAHVYGAIYQTNLKDFTLLDIGGQDTKIVKVEKGIITDLVLNDKCAASSGRYLENMALVLEITLNDLTNYYKSPVDLNSTCAVFGESELIGKIAEGYKIEELAAGVNYSLYQRIKPLLNNFRSRILVLTGGVAKNKAMQKFLESDFENIIIPDKPQLNGAIGCAYFSMRKKGLCNA